MLFRSAQCEFDRVADIAQAASLSNAELDAASDFAVVNVKAGNDTFGHHGGTLNRLGAVEAINLKRRDRLMLAGGRVQGQHLVCEAGQRSVMPPQQASPRGFDQPARGAAARWRQFNFARAKDLPATNAMLRY